jgi:uridine phosphorylase
LDSFGVMGETETLMSMDENQAIIEPRKGKREEPLPSRAILAFTPQDLELFRRHAPLLRQRSQRMYLANLFVGSYEGVPLVLAGPMLGAPQTVLVLEKLIALGATEVIGAGWCGSLQAGVRIGDLVLPTGAFSEEGTSSHYPITGPRPGPSPELLGALGKTLTGRGVAVHEGLVWSTDAPFRETVGKVVKYQKAGALAVDMEISALYTVAAFRGIWVAAVLVVSDDLSSLAWVHGFREPGFGRAREVMIESVMKAVSLEERGRG